MFFCQLISSFHIFKGKVAGTIKLRGCKQGSLQKTDLETDIFRYRVNFQPNKSDNSSDVIAHMHAAIPGQSQLTAPGLTQTGGIYGK